MTFLGKAEVLPPLFAQHGSDLADPYDEKRIQKLKWLVFVGAFIAVLLVGLIYVWSRPALFQSKAILHISYVSPTGDESESLPLEQVSLNQERLTSYRLLQQVSDKLLLSQSMVLSVEQLTQMLSSFAQPASRTIALQAIGSEADVLEPVLTTLLDIYLSQLNSENNINNGEDLAIIREKFAALEEKISLQRQELVDFSEANNIVSLQRDENRILSKIKSLGNSIDEAEAKKIAASSLLSSINASIASGESLTRPEDKAAIDSIAQQLSEINTSLADVAEQFTPQYMALDPKIVAMQRNADKLSKQLQTKIASSQQAYLEDAKRKLLEAQSSQNQFTEQLQALNSQAQDFNQKLDQYQGMDEALKQLQGQAQIFKNQLVNQEVGQSFATKLSIVEPPFEPKFSFAPNYLKDSMLVAGAALGSSLLALLVFSFIVRQKQPQARVTNYTVMPNIPVQVGSGRPELSQEQVFSLGMQNVVEPLQLQNINTSSTSTSSSSVAQLRILSERECVLLFDAANQQGKFLIGLVLSGVAPDELSDINGEDFDEQFQSLRISGRFARTMQLPSVLSAEIKKLALELGDSLWADVLAPSDFNHLLVNAAHDADIAFSEQLSVAVLRHSYITNLVVQGCKINDLEKVAGYIAAAELGQYRGVKRHGQVLELGQINTVFALAGEGT